MIGCELIIEIGYMGFYYINLFTFVYSEKFPREKMFKKKNPSRPLKRQLQTGRKYVIYIFDKGLTYRIYKELL